MLTNIMYAGDEEEQKIKRIVHRFQQSPTIHKRKLRAEPQLFQSGGRRCYHCEITTRKSKLRKGKVFATQDKHTNMKQKKSVPAEKSGYQNQENGKWGQGKRNGNRPKRGVFKRSENIGKPEEYVGVEDRDYPRRKNGSEEMNARTSEHEKRRMSWDQKDELKWRGRYVIT